MRNSQVSKSALCAAGALLSFNAAFAQWSADPGVNLPLADRAGEQVQPKIRATAGGGAFVSWYDNSTGGFDLYLQRLDAAGNEQWPHNGVLIADRGFSSTQDYGLDVDPAGNAILAFRDDSGGSTQIHASLVSPAGVLLWGATGVQASTTAGGNAPHVAATSGGNYVVGWTIGAGFRLQKLSSTGTPLWGADGILQSPATGSFVLSELVGSDAGNVIALWVRPVGNFLSNKHLYTQKYAPDSQPLWDFDPGTPATSDPVIVYDAGSVQFGYFPTFLSDDAGGAVFGWYETSGNRDAYVQRVDASGNELFAHNGVSASVTPNRLQLSPSVGFDPSSGEIFLAWTEANSVQSQWGLYAQRFSATGVRQWGGGGIEILPLAGTQPFFVNTLALDGGAVIAALSDPFAGTVVATRLDANGAALWTPAPLAASTVVGGKSRLNAALSTSDVLLMTWSDSRNDANDIYAQNVNPDGSLGPVACPGDLDGDNIVGLSDLAITLGNFGRTGDAQPGDGDLDGDGDVDLADLAQMLALFGTVCS